MTSPGFPDIKRSCKIGPITIRSNIPTKKADTITAETPLDDIEIGKDSIISPNDCNNPCTSDSKYKILYLAVATVGATVLCVVFLITTIIMCCKYHNKSSEVRGIQRQNITSW